MFLKYLCEFLGTMMLILLGDGVVANVTLNKSGMKGAGSIQITIAWGLAVMVPAFIFGEASGASFNPALTIALAVGGMFDWALVPGYVIAQILGGIVGGILVYILFKDHSMQRKIRARSSASSPLVLPFPIPAATSCRKLSRPSCWSSPSAV